MILVDTSVWIDHLNTGDETLSRCLQRGQVLAHELVIGELACGNLVNREEILYLLNRLPAALSASHDEALSLIERRALMGRGLGFIDVHLLASALLFAGCRLWTRDKMLLNVSSDLGLAFPEPEDE